MAHLHHSVLTCLNLLKNSSTASCPAAGDVFSPLDLLAYTPADAIAVQRAFGGMLIARNAKAATAVAVQFGLACVDLEGTVSRPGSLQVMLG